MMEFEDNDDLDESWNEDEESGSSDGESTDFGDDDIGIQDFSYIHFDSLRDQDVKAMSFNSVNDAENFYRQLGRSVGFGIRCSYKKPHPVYGGVRYRAWVCHMEGKRDTKHVVNVHRKRRPKPTSRYECKAFLKIKLDYTTMKYVVSKYESRHSHRLASPGSVGFLRSHRRVTEGHLAQAEALRSIGVGTTQIYRLFALQAGSFDQIGFTLRDLYNVMSRGKLKGIVGSDADSAIAYLAAKRDIDPMFYYTFDVNGEGKLKRLFWADAKARDDYRCFGDVLVLDSTYNTNDYEFPLVVFYGANNHYSTCIFACALIAREGEDGYDWVFNKFFEAMEGRKPISVVTDGDKGMKKAIQKIIPEARHRLCGWHLAQNCYKNLRNKQFLSEFKRCMYMNCTPDQFERHWTATVSRYNYENNSWIKYVYRKKEYWSLAYLGGHFFGGMRSTQRCEKMHTVLKAYLTKDMKLFEFVRAFEIGIAFQRYEERRFRCDTEHTSLLHTTLFCDLESHAGEIFTRGTFLKVRAEMEHQGMYTIQSISSTGTHFLIHNYTRSQYEVVYNSSLETLNCSCKKMETHGLPCRHMFRIMIHYDMRRLPDCSVLKRWTRDAGQEIFSSNDTSESHVRLVKLARYSRLMGQFTELCSLASETTAGFNKIEEILSRELTHIKEHNKNVGVSSNILAQNVEPPFKTTGVGVADPDPRRCRREALRKEKEKVTERSRIQLRNSVDGSNHVPLYGFVNPGVTPYQVPYTFLNYGGSNSQILTNFVNAAGNMSQPIEKNGHAFAGPSSIPITPSVMFRSTQYVPPPYNIPGQILGFPSYYGPPPIPYHQHRDVNCNNQPNQPGSFMFRTEQGDY